jgi:hypothetical protein
VGGILLLQKLNSLIKHSKMIMCIVVRLEVIINTSIFYPINAHAKNELLFSSKA